MAPPAKAAPQPSKKMRKVKKTMDEIIEEDRIRCERLGMPPTFVKVDVHIPALSKEGEKEYDETEKAAKAAKKAAKGVDID